MKNIVSMMLIASLGLFMLVFTGCKEETYTPEPLPQITISGTVYADLDLNIANDKAPAGVKIIFRIDSRDLVQTPITGYTYNVLEYTTTVGADGAYTITLPTATFAGVNVDIIPVDFKNDQIQIDNSRKLMTYIGGLSGVTTQSSQVYFQDLAYVAI